MNEVYVELITKGKIKLRQSNTDIINRSYATVFLFFCLFSGTLTDTSSSVCVSNVTENMTLAGQSIAFRLFKVDQNDICLWKMSNVMSN